MFNSKPLFVCVKDRVCLKVAIPAYCFTIFKNKSVNLVTNFSERKDTSFCCVQMMYTPFDS